MKNKLNAVLILSILMLFFIPVNTAYAKTKYTKTVAITNIQTKTLNVYKDSRHQRIKSVKSNNKNITLIISKDKKKVTVKPKKAMKATVKVTVSLKNTKKLYYKINLKTASHKHTWTKTYKTKYVQQYADDGTTNDYSKPITEEKPIYEDRPVYEESPIYETHIFNNGVDLTVAIRNYNAEHGTNYKEPDRYTNPDFNAYLISLGANSNRVYSDQVQVGTERVQVGTERVQVGTETVTVGYEQLGKKKTKVFTGISAKSVARQNQNNTKYIVNIGIIYTLE